MQEFRFLQFSEIDTGVLSRVTAAGVLLPSSAKITNEWSYICTPPYAFMARTENTLYKYFLYKTLHLCHRAL
jgi:hypothetical protein